MQFGFIKMKRQIAVVLALCIFSLHAATFETRIESDECWWGGVVIDGEKMPWTVQSHVRGDMLKVNYGNPAMPIFLSSKGRYIRCAQAFRYEIADGVIRCDSRSEAFQGGKVADDLPGVFRWCRDKWFPPSGRTPDLSLVSAPQYNTWIELQYNQNERDVLAYARAVREHGFPPGVMMIDDTWQLDYGTWVFDPRRFADPKGMCRKLHAAGFKVMLWMCPFVSTDSPAYRSLVKDGGLFLSDDYIRPGDYPFYVKPGTETDPAIVRWWNGKSAQVDLSHPKGREWFGGVLRGLVEQFGVDGFKLDAGDLCYFDGSNTYRHMRGLVAYEKGARAESLASRYTDVGLDFPLSEYRTVWGHAGEPIVVRLADKEHEWREVQRLIPHMAAVGLAGYPFVCPDMIGGGQWTSFQPGASFEPELFVRSAQVHALSPMMQFSAAPWRVLDRSHLDAVRKAVDLRMKWVPYLLEVAKASAKTGEPMLRNLEFAFPREGYCRIADQFMIGARLMVAPQQNKGGRTRTVVLPRGRWRADDGRVLDGPCEVSEETPLDRLPHYFLQ